MASLSSLPDCLAELRRRTSGEVRTDRYSRLLYSTDASIYQVEPLAVLIPRTVEDLNAAVELAALYEVPLLPRASGSSLAGQAVNEALVVDVTRHLDQVLAIDTEARRVRVQPGLVLDDLNTLLRPLGLQFGPDPASSDRAAIGGIVGNNSTGAHSILHGMTADHVLEMNVILSDGSTARFKPMTAEAIEEKKRQAGLEGELYRRIGSLVENEEHRRTIRAGTPRHWRRCGGYNLDRFVDAGVTFKVPPDNRFNLAKLVCGSEGTLAVMTDITLNLVPIVEHSALTLVHFDSLRAALSAVPVILEADPSAIELLDRLAITLCRGVPAYSRLLETFVEGEPDCLLITEFLGSGKSELTAKIDRLQSLLRRERTGSTGVASFFDPLQQQNVWKVRKVGLGLLMSIKGDLKPIPFIEDAAVPVEHLADYVIQLEDYCKSLGTEVAYYAHASAGCLHVRPLIDTKLASEVAKLPDIQSFSVELLQGFGGALSSEHGDGRSRSWMNERFFGSALYGLYKEVKLAFDPGNLLNPGNIVDAPPMTENLRYGETYGTRLPTIHLDFRQEQGFDRAIELCNGAGVCRKRTTGTMCPSFMVTRDEEHSTRGRANALRAVLSGRLPADEWTSPRMYGVMDLCIECKACKAECPSSVDMAKLKLEFLASYNKRHVVPLRTRLFADPARLGRIFCRPLLAPTINVALRNRPLRRALERIARISRHRSLPSFASRPFAGRLAEQEAPPESADGTVVLFNDTFNTYYTPEVAVAAAELLQAAGHEVVLSGHRCCGRPMISKGLLDEARDAARETVGRLAPLVARGLPVVALEPSCISALRDDYLYLLPDDPRVESIARQSLSLEEFLARRHDENRLGLQFDDETRRLLLHGHCHEKALCGTASSVKVLSLPTGHQVTEVDSGCCGMAGSFGYESEHHDLSIAMAERRLFPAVRNAGEEVLIVAAGSSCRQQIHHGTGIRALHPAQVLRRALATTTREV